MVALAENEINGELEFIDGIPVLRVWGTPYEMGFAQGYLLGGEIKAEFDNYIMPLVLHLEPVYNLATRIFTSLFVVPDRYQQEAEGIIDGTIAAGVDLFVPDLLRDLTALDLTTAGSMPDIIGLFGCSSLIAWGEATADDPVLAGDAAIVRNLDWVPTPGDRTYLSRRSVIVARSPDDRRQTMSIIFPGLLGCLSCMNDAGVSALQHQKHPAVPLRQRDFSQKFIPINLAMREGLELYDPDEDGLSSPDDEAAVVDSLPRSSQYVIMCLGPDFETHPPFVLETTNLESVKRYDFDDPGFPAMTLAATNDFRKLDEPTNCNRYATMKDNVNGWNGKLTLERMWQNNGDVAVNYWGSITAQTMIFIPAQRRIGLAYADRELLPTEKEPVWLDWEDIFPEPEIDDDVADDDVTDDDSNDDDEDSDDDAAPVTDDEDEDARGCGC